MKKQLKHIVVNINDLKPAAYNPREELRPGDPEYENIKNSIKEFGYADAIVVNKDLTVIGGHQRLNVLKDLGYSDIEVAQVDLTKKQEKALNIALNKITGRWDDNKLTDLFKFKRNGISLNATKKQAGLISGYAIKSNHETIAEAVADYYANGSRANIYSRAIVRVLKGK